jgi:hypothetical protein
MAFEPVESTQPEASFINVLLMRNDFTHDFWNKNTPKKTNRPDCLEKPIEKVKTKIKTHYKKSQGFRCPYCYYLYPTDHGMSWWTEHIIPKSLNKLLMFEPLNLCVACIDCNRIKDNKAVFINNNHNSFSHDSADYKIVHPHFDTYTDHIDIDGFLYTAVDKSPKGIETILMCDLARFISMGLDGEERSSDLINFYDNNDMTEVDMDELVAEFANDFL